MRQRKYLDQSLFGHGRITNLEENRNASIVIGVAGVVGETKAVVL